MMAERATPKRRAIAFESPEKSTCSRPSSPAPAPRASPSPSSARSPSAPAPRTRTPTASAPAAPPPPAARRTSSSMSATASSSRPTRALSALHLHHRGPCRRARHARIQLFAWCPPRPDGARLPRLARSRRQPHAHHLLRQGAAGRGLQRHLLLVAEPPRRDGARCRRRRLIRSRTKLDEAGAYRKESAGFSYFGRGSGV